MILGLIAAALFTGASFAPGTTNAPSCARMVPSNCLGYSFKPAAGASFFFARSTENPNVLIGPQPWVGLVESDKRVIRIWPELPGNGKSRPAGAMFDRGQLLGFSKDGVDYVYAKGSPVFKDKLEKLKDIFKKVNG